MAPCRAVPDVRDPDGGLVNAYRLLGLFLIALSAWLVILAVAVMLRVAL